MTRNPSAPNAKTLDENWKMAFGEVIQERKSKQKVWTILTISCLVILFIAYSGIGTELTGSDSHDKNVMKKCDRE